VVWHRRGHRHTIAAGIVCCQGYIAALLPIFGCFWGLILGGIYALLELSSWLIGCCDSAPAVANTIILVALWASRRFIVGWSDWAFHLWHQCRGRLVIGN